MNKRFFGLALGLVVSFTSVASIERTQAANLGPKTSGNCSAVTRDVAKASFRAQPASKFYGADLDSIISQRGDLVWFRAYITDRTRNGNRICEAQTCVNDRDGTVTEIVFKDSPRQRPNQNYSEDEFQAFAAEAAFALYNVRRIDDDSTNWDESRYLQEVSYAGDRCMIYRVRISDRSGTFEYDVTLSKEREIPVLRVVAK